MIDLRSRLRAIVPNARLPSGIDFSESSAGTVVLGVTAASFVCNMQDDCGAVDAWALVPLALGLADRVEIRLLTAGELGHDPGHALRLRFRLDWLQMLADSRLSIDPRLLNWRQSLPLTTRFVMNHASKPRPFGAKGTAKPTDESDLELHLADPTGPLARAAHLTTLTRQVPVGVFADRKCTAAALFPSRKAAIDLMGIDTAGTAWVFELKAQGNSKLGGLSELLFYMAVVQHVQRGEFLPRGGMATMLPGLKRESPLVACLLAPDHHPLLTANGGAVLRLLNAWCVTAQTDLKLTSQCRFCVGHLGFENSHAISVSV